MRIHFTSFLDRLYGLAAGVVFRPVPGLAPLEVWIAGRVSDERWGGPGVPGRRDRGITAELNPDLPQRGRQPQARDLDDDERAWTSDQ